MTGGRAAAMGRGGLLVPVALFVLAAIVRLVVAAQVPFPTTEVSAYFVGVAENLLAGRGLVSDAVWSFATPPLVAPKPAFEIWLPMASLVTAASMGVLGASFLGAQVGSALVGAAVAPLVWAVATEAVRTQGLDARRGRAAALAAGLIAAVLSPFVLAAVVPDSYTPFTVLVLVAALLLPRLLGVHAGRERAPAGDRRLAIGVALGIVMGAAYLSRQEVVWFGLTVVLAVAWRARDRAAGGRLRWAWERLWPVVVGGLVVVGPWLLRNFVELGSPLPGQAIENMFLVRNEDIFAFLDRPDLATYLAQGLEVVLANPVEAAVDGLMNVLVIPAFPIGVVGLLAVVLMWRAPAIRRPTALAALLVSGALTFATTVLLFPVATLWGTFAHASGPLLAALVVMAALGGDALLARISAIRRWEKPNVIVAPIALLAIVLLLTVLQVRLIAEQSRGYQGRYAGLAAEISRVGAETGSVMPATIITDHPMWMADALDLTAVALPDEPTGALSQLARTFGAPWVVVIDDRGRYPDALLRADARACLASDPRPLSGGDDPAWLFILDETCREA